MSREGRSRCERDDLIVLPDDHVIGESTAPVTVIAYCDFECPYCEEAHLLISRLRATLPDQFRYVYRHFPIVKKHPHAQLAAEASVAAAMQDRFWPMHDRLFENQARLELDHLYLYASLAGLDVQTFKDDLRAGAGVLKVRRDLLSGHRCGVEGTPTFFVNDVLLSDHEDLEHRVRAQV